MRRSGGVEPDDGRLARRRGRAARPSAATRVGEGLVRLFVARVRRLRRREHRPRHRVSGAHRRSRGSARSASGSSSAHAVWKPEANLYGGLPLIVGTVISATGAVILGAAPAVLTALWVIEFAPRIAANGVPAADGGRVGRAERRLRLARARVPRAADGEVARGMYGPDAQVGGEGLASAAVLLGVMIVPDGPDPVARLARARSLVAPRRERGARRLAAPDGVPGRASGRVARPPRRGLLRARAGPRGRRWPCRW